MAVEYIHFLAYSGKKDSINKINTTDKNNCQKITEHQGYSISLSLRESQSVSQMTTYGVTSS